MADPISTIIRFATSDGRESSTVWRDCTPPRSGDMTKISHEGRSFIVRCGASVIGWEGGHENAAQVFAVSYKPVKAVSEARADSLVGEEG